ncbi:MAG: PASTA domain-containing protein [Oscillospiraceae bacterium]|nr:PASTA domain-containing protein [Oscillospiraceae bacterium]
MEEQERAKKNVDRRANRRVLWRTCFLLVVFGVLFFIPLAVKLWNIQITNHDYYQNLAIEQQTRDVTVSANRGTIYDANSSVLAVSATVHTVILSPKDVAQLQANYAEAVEKAEAGEWSYPDYPEPTGELIAAGLSEILGVDESTVLEKLENTSRQYEVVASKVEEDLANQVLEFIAEYNLTGGIYLEPDTKRYYPYSSLASHIIGFVNAENSGAYGLEAKYDDVLSGEAGRVVTAKNGANTEMLFQYETYIDAVDGADMTLTVDVTIQSLLESALAEGIEKFDVRYGGFAIAMDPDTGAILGMAATSSSTVGYDLNTPSAIADEDTAQALAELEESGDEDAYLEALSEAQLDQWRNKTLNDTYEPGSTFKILVLAAALEEGVVSLDDTFYCSGSTTVNGTTIRCSNHAGHGTQTLAEALANSCNSAFIEIGQRLGAEKFYDYLERYNLIGTTGVDLPGEASNSSLVWSRDYFTSLEGYLSLATASFGQRLKLTPLQLMSAVSAVLNGGYLMQPYVVDYAAQDDGTLVYSHEDTVVRQVISESTSETMRTLLEGVVDGGTGKNAYVAGYRIAGKTGTSETDEDDRYVVSFLGAAPANDPQVVVLLAYDGPTPVSAGSNYTAGGVYISGGNMAAPMAGQLIADILDYMDVSTQYKAEELTGSDVSVPNVVGLDVDSAGEALEARGLTWRTVGSGEEITGQLPAAGSEIPENSQVVLYLGDSEVPDEQVEVPDLTGLSPEAVQTALNALGLYMRATGSVEFYTSTTTAFSQSVSSGTLVDPGTVIDVYFVDGSVVDFAGAAVEE